MKLSEAFAEAADLLRSCAAAEDLVGEEGKKKGRKRRKKGSCIPTTAARSSYSILTPGNNITLFVSRGPAAS